MLFNYKTFQHDIEKLQTFLEHTVLEVWYNSKRSDIFSKSLLHPDFTVLYNRKNKLYKDIEEIFNLIKILSKAKKELIKVIFITNNKIEELCKGNGQAVFYKSLENGISKKLADKLKDFNNYLYTFLDKKDASFVKNFKSITTYYKELVLQLPEDICPFCGIATINSEKLTKRDAFDHYLPKSLFPFTAVNINNLAPMCKYCNQDWKHDINPINTDKDNGNIRKTFFPFNNTLYNINISIKKLEIDPSFKKDNHIINIGYDCVGHNEEIDTWLELFNIKNRYDILIKNNLKFWLEEFLIIKNSSTLTKDQYIQNKLDNRFINNNFLNIEIIKTIDN